MKHLTNDTMCTCPLCIISTHIRSPGSSVDLALAYWSSGPSSILTRGEIFSTVNGVPLHTAFHYHPNIVLIWLKYCWKGRKIAASHPSIHPCTSYWRIRFRFIDSVFEFLFVFLNKATFAFYSQVGYALSGRPKPCHLDVTGWPLKAVSGWSNTIHQSPDLTLWNAFILLLRIMQAI